MAASKILAELQLTARLSAVDPLPRIEPFPLFDSANLSRGYFPSRMFLYSVFGHLIGFSLLICLSILRNVPGPPSVVDEIMFIDLRIPNVIYLPTLIGAGDQGMKIPASKPAPAPKKPAEAPAARTKGLSYPGPQPIVSDVPNPTNQILTVLQPDLENPPILVPPLPLPNIVQIADLAPATPKAPEPPAPEPVHESRPPEPPPVKPPDPPPEVKAPEPEMAMPELPLAPPVRMDVPKLVLSPSATPAPEVKPSSRPAKIELPSLVKATPLPDPPREEAPAPEAKPSEAPPKPAEPANAETAPREREKPKEAPAPAAAPSPGDKKDLLVLSPMPASSKEPVNVPAGEARGRFAISPEANVSASEKEPGLKTGTRSESIGVGKNASAPAGGAAASKKAWTISGGAGANGSASGGGTQSGSGSGSASGKKAFAGITIMGGEFEPGSKPELPPVTRARKPLQTSYGLNIISTEDSGGGLPFFGVFSSEQIYTVYLDMREEASEQDPSWTLEFAIINGNNLQSGATVDLKRKQQGLILPFPAEKQRPAFPEDLIRKYLNKMVIVYGIVNVEGKLEQLSVKASPDASFNGPVLAALARWIFKPAQLNGEPVAAKLLMGIPLWLPQ